MLIAAVGLAAMIQVSTAQATHCDPPVFVPPSLFATRFEGQVVELATDETDTSNRRTAMVEPRTKKVGELPSDRIKVVFYDLDDGPCTHLQRRLAVGDLVDVFLDAQGQSITWDFVATVSWRQF